MIEVLRVIKENWDLVLFIIGVLISALGWLSTKVKSAKAKRILEKAKKAAEDLNKMADQVPKVVEAAEKFVNFKGKEKKQFALTTINQWCIDNGIPFDKDKADELIERAVEISKKVNSREKDLEVLQ